MLLMLLVAGTLACKSNTTTAATVKPTEKATPAERNATEIVQPDDKAPAEQNAMEVVESGDKAVAEQNATEIVQPDDKAAAAEQEALAIEREHYARRACRHEKRVRDLADKKSRWRARVRHAEKAALWWNSIETGDAKQCPYPIVAPES